MAILNLFMCRRQGVPFSLVLFFRFKAKIAKQHWVSLYFCFIFALFRETNKKTRVSLCFASKFLLLFASKIFATVFRFKKFCFFLFHRFSQQFFASFRVVFIRIAELEPKHFLVRLELEPDLRLRLRPDTHHPTNSHLPSTHHPTKIFR